MDIYEKQFASEKVVRKNSFDDIHHHHSMVFFWQPTFMAPSIPYPSTVGPKPPSKTPGPSSLTRSTAVAAMPLLYLRGLDWILVLTTSIGVVIPCEMAAQVPPATKYRKSRPWTALRMAPSPRTILGNMRRSAVDTRRGNFMMMDGDSVETVNMEEMNESESRSCCQRQEEKEWMKKWSRWLFFVKKSLQFRFQTCNRSIHALSLEWLFAFCFSCCDWSDRILFFRHWVGFENLWQKECEWNRQTRGATC